MRSERSLSRTLLIQSSAFLFLILISGATGLGLLVLQYQSDSRAAELGRVVEAIHELRGDLYRQLKELFDFVFIGDPNALAEFEAFGRDIDQNLAALAAIAHDQAIAAEVAELNAAYMAVRARARTIMNQTHAGFAPNELLDLFETSLEKGDVLNYERAFAATGAVVEAAQQELRQRAALYRQLSLAGLAVPLVVGLILLLASRALLRRRIAEPVSSLLGAIEDYKGGRLARSVPETGPAEFRKLQEAFNRMAAQLQASQDALLRREMQATTGALVPIIAHNIRNPLASIRATAQLMQDPGLSDEQRGSLDAILRTVDRLDGWISQFLTYLNPLSPSIGETSMAAVADSAVQLLGHRIAAKRIDVLRRGGDATLTADQSLLEQAVCGLLSNAIDASPPGAEIVLEIAAQGGDASLAIRDHGPGMPFPEGPSGMTPGPTTKTLGGGLGVPFARKICEIHGGSLEFREPAAGGTQVLIRLPKSQPGAGQ
ncbi:MAG: ATP-binding protein [Kiloniellales bacterium]